MATEADRWLFFLRHVAELESPPKGLSSNMFEKAFQEASIAQLTPEQRRLYEEGMRESRDLHNAFVYAKKEGVEIGKREGEHERSIEVARTALREGLAVSLIAKITGLNEDFIKSLED